MNKNITSIYVCVSNNKVFCCDTNLSSFYREFKTKYPKHIKTQSWMRYHFDLSHDFTFEDEENNKFYFYKIDKR